MFFYRRVLLTKNTKRYIKKVKTYIFYLLFKYTLMRTTGLCLGVIVIMAMMCACGNNSKKSAQENTEEYSCSDMKEVTEPCSILGDVSVFKAGELYGVRNAEGEVLLPPQYAKVVHYGISELHESEFAFWRKSECLVGNCVPDAEIFYDRWNLLVRKDSLNGLFSWKGKELLPLRYPEIYSMTAAGSYAVTSENGDMLIWKDGKFIVDAGGRAFYGTDLEKKQYVFSDEQGLCWDFYDFDGKNRQRLRLKEAPKGVSLPQLLENGRFLVDNNIVNARGTVLKMFPEWTEVCGNFLMVPETANEDKYSVFFNSGRELASGVDNVYMVVTEDKPHLPTGDIIVEVNGSLEFYDRLGKKIKNVSSVNPVWLFAEIENSGVPVYSEY